MDLYQNAEQSRLKILHLVCTFYLKKAQGNDIQLRCHDSEPTSGRGSID